MRTTELSMQSTINRLRAELEAKNQEIKTLQDRVRLLESMIRFDPLTGALTRTGFEKATSRRVPRWDHPNFKPTVGVFYLDANHFKAVNDRFGHDVGDQTLKSLVTLLQESTRPIDLIARAGGDEFWVVVQTNSLADLKKVITRINQDVSVRVQDVVVNFAVGVVIYRPGEGIKSAIARAETLMYKAKQSDGDRLSDNVCASFSY